MSRFLATGLLWMALQPGCGGRPRVAHPLTVSALVDGERDERLPGVSIVVSGRRLGETDASGRLVTEVQGADGQELALVATCPKAFRGPPGPIPLRLSRVRSLGDAVAGALTVTVSCRPLERAVAIVVAARELPGAPVLVNGSPRGRTDGDGVTHLLVLAMPGNVLTVSLGADLARSVRVADRDQVLVLADAGTGTGATRRARRPRSLDRIQRIQRIQ